MGENNGYTFSSDVDESTVKGWFRREFSIGNIATILTILCGIIIAYENLKNDSANDHAQIVEMKQTNKAQVDDLRQSISVLNNTLIETNLAVRELRTTVQMEGTRTRQENRENKQ
jgi:hypothetical protein